MALTWTATSSVCGYLGERPSRSPYRPAGWSTAPPRVDLGSHDWVIQHGRVLADPTQWDGGLAVRWRNGRDSDANHIHFGYVGKTVGFPRDFLQAGADDEPGAAGITRPT